jgi:serine/threonine protein kinase
VAVSVDDVIQRIEDSGILDDVELSAVRGDAEAVGGDSEKFVRVLVKKERLTTYQAQAIWKNKGHKLSFDNYIIEAELGRGGMGVVLKARHRRMKRYVAIKVLPATMAKDAAAIARFQREVEAAAQLTHPNIVGAHDANEINGQYFLVMEFVDGRDLSMVIKRNGPQPVEQAVNFTIQAARGLEFAHEQGVIHRDIKPANLLLDTKGTVKILDMGLARFSDDAEVGTQAELTGTGTVMGTVDYMSPEQAVSTKTADARSDIYSLGITLYYLLTAKSAYEGDSLIARLMAHANNPVPSLRESRPDVPGAIQHVFEKMVAKQADDRYQSMTEVIAAIENCHVKSAAAAVELSGVSPTSLGSPGESELSKVLASPPTSEEADKLPMPATLPRLDTEAASVITDTPMIITETPTIITSSLSNTIQTNITKETGQRRSGSGRPAWMSDKRILAGAGASSILLLIVAFEMFSTDPVNPPTGSEIASVGESRPTAKSSSTNRAATPSKSVTRDTLVAPPVAVAPFDAAQAKKHQEAWAKHLGEPVETTNSIGMKFVVIPPGEFEMGEEDNTVPVTLTKPFRFGVHEVTQGQFRTVMGTEPWKDEGHSDVQVGENVAASRVNWMDATTFCKKLTESERAEGRLLTDEEYRLPTEAEWAYACRAGTTTIFSFGDDESQLGAYAWYASNAKNAGEAYAHAVGMKKPNLWGLHDIHGNVYEWCGDWHAELLQQGGMDPRGPSEGSLRVLRGGSWHFLSRSCRSASRRMYRPVHRHLDLGFRVLRSSIK